MMKKLCSLLLALLLMTSLCAAEDVVYWICPECGQGANTGNYCTNCAAPSPAPSNINENLTQIPGETDHVMVDVLRIDGSSYIKAKKNKYLHAPEKACDEDETTCWQFTAKKNAKEKGWLSMIVEGETVDEIWIRNGIRTADSKAATGWTQWILPSRKTKPTAGKNWMSGGMRTCIPFGLSSFLFTKGVGKPIPPVCQM